MTSRGLEDARRLLQARKGPPDKADHLPASTFSGANHKPLAGQLDIFGIEHVPPAGRHRTRRCVRG
jgi:hypothetical protein